MSNSINRIVLIAFVKLLLCSYVGSAIDGLVQDYLNVEKNLWHLVRSTNVHNIDDTLIHIYDAHERFLGKNFGEAGIFDALSKQDRTISDENRIIERHVWRLVDSIQHINITALNTQRILSHNQYEYMPNMMKDIAQNMPKMIATLCKYTDTDFWMFVKNNSQICYKDVVNVRSENEALSDFYVEVVVALLKCYMLLQMTYMVQTVNDLGNFNDPADKLRESFTFNVTAIQNYVLFELKNSSRAVWACDPDDFYDPDSYIEITRFFQGYVENEINLDPGAKCQRTCDEYTETRHYVCSENSFCEHLTDPLLQSKLICNGTVLNCQYFDGDFNICPAEERSARRYKFLEYDDGRVFGGENNCNNLHPIRAKSWWSWFYHCSLCFCHCDDKSQSDRYFSLRSVVSNTKENKVISGIGLTKVNRIIQLKILERELLPNGRLSHIDVTNTADSQSWRTSKQFSIDDYDIEEGVDVHTISWSNRSIDLDTVVDADRVVTGVRFRVVNSHLRIEVRFTSFNYQTGKLIDIQGSEWIANNNSAEKKILELQYPDRSTRSKEKSIPIRGKNHYINLQPSDRIKDAAQSTIPFFDSGKVESQKPLSGIGLYYKTQFGFGGFIAPKLIVFDASLDITPINNF